MGFNFQCEMCKFGIVDDQKFSIDSTEWETESEGCGGGVDAESICVDCHNEIKDKINSMYKVFE